MPGIDKQIWPLIVVGRGSSAAFYVSTLNLGDYAGILAIGDGDAWSAAVRGHHGDRQDPTRFINHPHYLIAHFSDHLPEFSAEKVDRLEWAKSNNSVLTECKVRLHNGIVKMVSEVDVFPIGLRAEDSNTATGGFKVALGDGTFAYAYKVVMAAGAGGHRVPGELISAKKRDPRRYLDLDEFAKLSSFQLKGKTVFVLGPNAAIDAVQKAIHYNCKIIWLIKGNAQPPVLDTQPAVKAALAKNPNMIHRYTSLEFLHSTSDGISVKLDGSVKFASYFAYGMGQTGETFDAIDSTISKTLVPVFDKNGYLGDKPGTILAYEAEGTGLKNGFEVVGAMAAQVGRKLRDGTEIKKRIAEVRSIRLLHDSIQAADFPVAKPFLLKDPEFLANQPRLALRKQLETEARFVAKGNKDIADGLHTLVALLLSFHGVKNYRTLMNQQTQNMPKGAVADSGQLTSIGAAMGAKHNFVPKHVGTQEYTGNANKESADWVPTKTRPGEVNFSKDNATVLQIGLSIKYPYISDKDLNAWVSQHMRKLHQSGVGFVNNKQFDNELALLNRKGLDALKVF